MTSSQLLSTILVISGIIFLLAAVRLCVRTRRQVPLSLAGTQFDPDLVDLFLAQVL